MDELNGIPRPPRTLFPGTTARLMKTAMVPLLLGGIWFLVGLAVGGLFFLLGNPLRDYQLSRGTAAAEATVTEIKLDYSTRINERNPWIIRYAFQANGQTWEGKSSTLDESFVGRLAEGSKIQVEYLPSNASVNRAKGTMASVFPLPVFIAPAFFLVGGGLVFVAGMAKVFRMRSLIMNGEVTLGKVNHLFHRGGKQPINVFYTFADSRGMEWIGRTRTYSYGVLHNIALGQQVKIVYDYANPNRNFAFEVYGIHFPQRT
jgi:hypothetical protein